MGSVPASAAAADDSQALCSVAPGCTVTVRRLDPRHDAVGDRLADLGFLPGTTVRVVRRAPLGDPTIYELRGTQLCLRKRETARILVGP